MREKLTLPRFWLNVSKKFSFITAFYVLLKLLGYLLKRFNSSSFPGLITSIQILKFYDLLIFSYSLYLFIFFLSRFGANIHTLVLLPLFIPTFHVLPGHIIFCLRGAVFSGLFCYFYRARLSQGLIKYISFQAAIFAGGLIFMPYIWAYKIYFEMYFFSFGLGVVFYLNELYERELFYNK